MRPINPKTLSALAVAVAAAMSVAAVNAQDSIRGAPSEANHFIGTPSGWTHPMQPWGEPNIEAMLNMMQAAGVPLERCANTGFAANCDLDKAWLTEEEYTQRLAGIVNRVDRSRQALAEGNLGASIQSGLTDPSIPQRQTNLIVEPKSGLLPELTAEAKRRALMMGSDWALPGEDIVFEDETDFDSWDRCLTRGMPSSMMPYRYNGGFRITQAPGYVVFELEMIHEARVIPTNGAPPLDPNIKQYMGESRGRWEGNTLVIETTNYREGPPMINLAVVGSPPGNRFPISDQMKTTERITRLNDEWWLYEITTEDPVILSAPFTVRYPMHNDPNYWWPEYACHEDNTIVHNYVSTNRYERANPPPEPEAVPVSVSPELANTLEGTWVGRPRIPTIDVDIELEFSKFQGNTVHGRLVGTNLGVIDKPLRSLRIQEQPDRRAVDFQLPNIQAWSFSGAVTPEGTLEGIVRSSQGSLPVTFHKQD